MAANRLLHQERGHGLHGGGHALEQLGSGLRGRLAFQAFARRLTVLNCGCFGAYLQQELPWWVLLEDIAFVAVASWTLVRRRPPAVAAAPKRHMS